MGTTMLAKTSAYVRRTSVARSTPLRIGNVLTAGLYEKPMASSDSVGEFDENIYPTASRKSRRWSAAWTGRDRFRRPWWRWRTGRGCILHGVLAGPLQQRNITIHRLEHDFSRRAADLPTETVLAQLSLRRHRKIAADPPIH